MIWWAQLLSAIAILVMAGLALNRFIWERLAGETRLQSAIADPPSLQSQLTRQLEESQEARRDVAARVTALEQRFEAGSAHWSREAGRISIEIGTLQLKIQTLTTEMKTAQQEIERLRR